MKLSFTGLLLFCSSVLLSQIQLNNQFGDWNGIDHIEADDGSPFVETAITSNIEWIYLHIQFENEVGLGGTISFYMIIS